MDLEREKLLKKNEKKDDNRHENDHHDVNVSTCKNKSMLFNPRTDFLDTNSPFNASVSLLLKGRIKRRANCKCQQTTAIILLLSQVNAAEDVGDIEGYKS